MSVPDLRGGKSIDDFVRELEAEGVDFSEARAWIARACEAMRRKREREA